MKPVVNKSIEYLKYLMKSEGLQYIHSPFLFELMKNVFTKSSINELKIIEQNRKKLLNDNRLIHFKDYGTGGDDVFEKQIQVKQIAKKSLKAPKYSQFLYSLAKHIEGKKIIELGTSLGITTQYLSHIKKAMIHTIDASIEVQKIASAYFSPNVQTYCFDLNSHFSSFITHHSDFDLLFIDANHRPEAMHRYFLQSLLNIKDSACIVFDDIRWNGEMYKEWQKIITNQKITLSFEIYELGVVFFNPNLSKQHFILKY